MNGGTLRNIFIFLFWSFFSLLFLTSNFSIIFNLNYGNINYSIIYIYFVLILILNLFQLFSLIKDFSIKKIFYIKIFLHTFLIFLVFFNNLSLNIFIIPSLLLCILGNIALYYEMIKNTTNDKLNEISFNKIIILLISFLFFLTLFNKELVIPYIPKNEFKLEIVKYGTLLNENNFDNYKITGINDTLNYEWESYLYNTREALNIPFIFSINDMRAVYRFRLYDFKINGNISSIYIPNIRKHFLSDFYIKKGLLNGNSGILESLKSVKK